MICARIPSCTDCIVALLVWQMDVNRFSVNCNTQHVTSAKKKKKKEHVTSARAGNR